MAEVKSLTIRHEAIMDYLMMNPTERLQDVATKFGVTGPWLSTIIHSDAFQEQLKAKQDIVFHTTVLPIREKMTQAAHAGLDRILEELPKVQDVRTINDVTEGMLDRLGFGAKPIGGTNLTFNQQNNLVVPNANAAEIANARKMLEAKRTAVVGVQLDGIPYTIALSSPSNASMGETIEANIHESSGENGSRESRAEV